MEILLALQFVLDEILKRVSLLRRHLPWIDLEILSRLEELDLARRSQLLHTLQEGSQLLCILFSLFLSDFSIVERSFDFVFVLIFKIVLLVAERPRSERT